MATPDSVNLNDVVVDPSSAMLVPAEYAFEHNILPLCVLNGDLIVAMADKTDVMTLADLRRALGMPAVGVSVDPKQLKDFLTRIYGGIKAALNNAGMDDAVSTVDYLIRMAFIRHASDIHFDPEVSGMRVRFRIDGELTDVTRINPEQQPSVISRLKVMGDMKLDERRAPQDGSFIWKVPDAFANKVAALEIRMATLPGHYGEKVTLRLLETGLQHQTTDSLGMLENDLNTFENVLRCPNGMILLTGPTGNGKTTTLYAAIQHLLKGRAVNILTVEDPVEYEIPGIFQAEVDGADKVNFSKALKSILRHDPDVIMIGEIRDAESLDTAIKAALTGHLVLSTLHTNNALNAVTRLANMGTERHLIADTLRLSVSQRLVRRLCPFCRSAYTAGRQEADILGRQEIIGKTMYTNCGCVFCAGRGMIGRTGLFEMFRPDEDISTAIASGIDEVNLRKLYKANGGATLLDDGINKCLQGITTVQEVGRVAFW